MKPNKKQLMSSYQLPGNMAEKVIFLNPKKDNEDYVFGGYQSFMQESIDLRLLCFDLSISHSEAMLLLRGQIARKEPETPTPNPLTPAPTKPAAKRFIKPVNTEVFDYMKEKGVPQMSAMTEADKFVDFYSSNGWKVGKNPMKDWKAAARNWMKNKSSFGGRGAVDQSGFLNNDNKIIDGQVVEPSQAGFLTYEP